MKRLLLAMAAALSFLHCTAQADVALETMMTRKVLHCEDIELNMIHLLPDLYSQGNKDSTIVALLDYAGRKCPHREPFLSFSLLYAIRADTFQLSNYNPYYLNRELRYFLNRNKHDTFSTRAYPFINAFDKQTLDTYYNAVTKMAGSIAGRTFKTDFENKLIDFYIHPSDSLLKELQEIASDKKISREYYQRQGTRDGPGSSLHMSVFSGAWIPRGNLSLIGTQPYVGFQYGGGTRKFQASLTIAARFGRAANSFSVLRTDSLYRSRHYGGAYFGVDGGYALLQGKRHALNVLAGGGLETFKTLSIEQKDDDDNITKRIYSPNLNLGIGYKYWFYAAYIGLELKYNMLFFRNRGGTDLSGNVFTLGLSVGFVSH